MTEYAARSTGIRQHIGADQMRAQRERFDKAYGQALRERKHLWIATFAYYVTLPLHDDYPFDVENLAQGPAVGCYICEATYLPSLTATEGPDRRCPGEPS